MSTDDTAAIDYAGPLTDDQIQQYNERGYLAINNVLSAEQMQELRNVTDGFIAASASVTENTDVFDLEPDHTPEKPKLRRLKEPHLRHEAYDRVLRSDKILDLVQQLLGPDIYFKTSKLNIKGAEGGSPVEWHQDWGFFPHTNDSSLALGLPLDDMAVENGCLMVVPGSHRGPTLDHHQDGLFVGAVNPDGVEELAVPIELRAGGISMHHVRLLHGSAPNLSLRPRRLLLFQYVAADSWPLTEGTRWDAIRANMLRGELTSVPRLEKLPVRLPYPRLPHSSIYDVQSKVKRRGFQQSAE